MNGTDKQNIIKLDQFILENVNDKNLTENVYFFIKKQLEQT